MPRRSRHHWTSLLVALALLSAPFAKGGAAMRGALQMVICGAGGVYTVTLPNGEGPGEQGRAPPLCCLLCAAPALPPATRQGGPLARHIRLSDRNRSSVRRTGNRSRRPHPVRAPPAP